MEQQSNYQSPKIPKDEKHLQQILDELYADAKEKEARNKYPKQNGLLEIISSPITILTAYHNIKPNKGAMTPGTDGQTVRTLLEKPYEQAIGEIQSAMKNYRAQPIRRTLIPKPGKEEKRKLGIPSITDRIVQECVRMVIEPILEAQFFPYSFGFRPYREASMALERVTDLVHKTGKHWVVEGDIKKYFDTINHTRLIKQLWHMGIRDRRVLMLIKQMLKAGVMKESEANEIGTPQGGIISPLLANVYLNSFDWYIGKSWEFKRLKKQYNCKGARIKVQKKKTNLSVAYLIRYADDWVIVTDSKRHAEQWKWKAKEKLRRQYKLELSEEKTKITNVKEKAIHFLGFTFKVRKDAHAKLGYVTCTRPEIERLRIKMPQIKGQIKELGRCKKKIVQKAKIGQINATIRGIINYYRSATQVIAVMKKVSESLTYLGKKIMRRKLGAKCIPAEKTDNLRNVHEGYKSQVPYIEVAGEKIGLTSLLFCRWKKAKQKNQKETPYTEEGREIYQKRSKKSLPLPRSGAILQKQMEQAQKKHADSRIHNFEYYLNRAYAYNRDKGKCKVCGRALTEEDMIFHHNRPCLPVELVNRVSNLASLCTRCHCEVHATGRPGLAGKENRKIMRMREKLSMESHRNLMERRMKRKFHVRCESREKRDRTALKNARGSLLPIDAVDFRQSGPQGHSPQLYQLRSGRRQRH